MYNDLGKVWPIKKMPLFGQKAIFGQILLNIYFSFIFILRC